MNATGVVASPCISTGADSRQEASSPHWWQVASQSSLGDYAGRTIRGYTAKCIRPGCSAKTVFPVDPGEVKGVPAPCVGPCAGGSPSDLNSPRNPVAMEVAGKVLNGTARKVGRPPDHARARFYEDNRLSILSDFAALGKADMLQKWGIPVYKWRQLQKEWNCTTRVSQHAGNGNGRNGNGHHSLGHDVTEGPDVALTSTIAAQANLHAAQKYADKKVLTSILRKMAEADISSEVARGLRLAIAVIETV